MLIRSFIKRVLPWLITVVALYFTFRDIDWKLFYSHIWNADFLLILGAVFLTILSYFFRGRRWQSLFPETVMNYADSTRVLTLGFFYNNILPARAGEFVRAYLGAQLTGKSRALVLATIASERLIDGLTISIMFVLFALNIGDHEVSDNLIIVAGGFAGISMVVLCTLIFRNSLFSVIQRIQRKSSKKSLHYTLTKLHTFIDGLSPLCSLRRAPILGGWSIIIWFNELLVFYLVTHAYGGQIPFAQCVLFMVSVNFASLIPAAPGGLGVIEAVGTAVLVSIGVPRELALTMVLTQHVIQYVVVGVPGAFLTLTWRTRLEKLRVEISAQEAEAL